MNGHRLTSSHALVWQTLSVWFIWKNGGPLSKSFCRNSSAGSQSPFQVAPRSNLGIRTLSRQAAGLQKSGREISAAADSAVSAGAAGEAGPGEQARLPSHAGDYHNDHVSRRPATILCSAMYHFCMFLLWG